MEQESAFAQARTAQVEIEKQPLLKPALSILGSHAGGVLISNILCFGLSGMMSNWGLLLAIPLIFLVYSMPIYGTAWAMGLSDSNKANFGHIVLDKWRGAKLCLVAISPWLVSGLLFILSKFGLFYNFTIIFKLLNAEVWPAINAVHVFAGQEVSMYLPSLSFFQAFLAAILTVLPVIPAQLGYFLGTKDISISQKLIYKNTKKGGKNVQKPEKTTYDMYQERQKHSSADLTEPKEKTSLLHKILYKDDTK